MEKHRHDSFVCKPLSDRSPFAEPGRFSHRFNKKSWSQDDVHFHDVIERKASLFPTRKKIVTIIRAVSHAQTGKMARSLHFSLFYPIFPFPLLPSGVQRTRSNNCDSINLLKQFSSYDPISNSVVKFSRDLEDRLISILRLFANRRVGNIYRLFSIVKTSRCLTLESFCFERSYAVFCNSVSV